MSSLFQGLAGQAPGPWTSAQIHDTVAKIVAQPHYGATERQSLLGRFLRYLFQHFVDFLKLFRGSGGSFAYFVIFVVLLVGGVIVARIVVARRAEEGRRRALGIRAKFGDRIDYWAVARDEAASGRYAEACHAVYAAVIDTFTRQGVMKFHASKTSGDYARDLRRAGVPAAADFRVFARQFDRVIFGETTVRADDYVRLRESAERAASMRKSA